jgi:hypothetical protein
MPRLLWVKELTLSRCILYPKVKFGILVPNNLLLEYSIWHMSYSMNILQDSFFTLQKIISLNFRIYLFIYLFIYYYYLALGYGIKHIDVDN